MPLIQLATDLERIARLCRALAVDSGAELEGAVRVVQAALPAPKAEPAEELPAPKQRRAYTRKAKATNPVKPAKAPAATSSARPPRSPLGNTGPTLRDRMIDALAAGPMTKEQLAEAIGSTPASCGFALTKPCNAGEIIRVSRGVYGLPGAVPSSNGHAPKANFAPAEDDSDLIGEIIKNLRKSPEQCNCVEVIAIETDQDPAIVKRVLKKNDQLFKKDVGDLWTLA